MDLDGLTLDRLRDLDRYLTPSERAEIEQLLDASAVIWTPQAGPQTMAVESEADVVGFGGAAGGGKTDCAVGMALTQHRKSAIFRREATQLTGIIDRITDMLGTRDGFSSKDKIWRVTPAIAPVARPLQIEFGSAPNLGDEKRYQGRPKDLLVLDEATEFAESQVRFLMGWIRTVVQGQRTRALLTFNPPTTSEGRWVLQFFGPWLDPNYPVPAEPGEVRWFVMLEGKEVEWPDGQPFEWRGETIYPKSRTFIPSRIADNPYLVATGYMSQLQALPEPLRSQMLYGDFQAGMSDDEYQVIPTEWVDLAMRRWREKTPKGEQMSVGVDVARGGKDDTVVATRYKGWWFDRPKVVPGRETKNGRDVVGAVVPVMRHGAFVHIDVIGVGASPYDILNEMRLPVIGVNVSNASHATDKSGKLHFSNLRAELWWRFRELLDPDEDTGVALPPDKRLRKELTAPRWKLSGRNIAIESREDLVKRLGWSPDLASAFILAAVDTPKSLTIDHVEADVSRSVGHDPYAAFRKR